MLILNCITNFIEPINWQDRVITCSKSTSPYLNNRLVSTLLFFPLMLSVLAALVCTIVRIIILTLRQLTVISCAKFSCCRRLYDEGEAKDIYSELFADFKDLVWLLGDTLTYLKNPAFGAKLIDEDSQGAYPSYITLRPCVEPEPEP